MATKEDILESIANMTVLEVSELVKAMEEKFGVKAEAPVAVAAAPAAGGARRPRKRRSRPNSRSCSRVLPMERRSR